MNLVNINALFSKQFFQSTWNILQEADDLGPCNMELETELPYDEEIDEINSLTVPSWLRFPDSIATTSAWPFERVEKQKDKPITIKLLPKLQEVAAPVEVATPVEEVAAPIEEMVEEAATPVEEVLEEVTTPIEEVVEEVAVLIEVMVEEAATPEEEVLEEVTTPVEEVVEEIAVLIEETVEEAATPVEEVLEEVANPVEEVVEEVAVPVEEIVEEVAAQIKEVLEEVAVPVEEVVEEIAFSDVSSDEDDYQKHVVVIRKRRECEIREKEEEIRSIKKRRESKANRTRVTHNEEREALEMKIALERELEIKETLLEVMQYEEAKDAMIQLKWQEDEDELRKMKEASLQVISGSVTSTRVVEAMSDTRDEEVMPARVIDAAPVRRARCSRTYSSSSASSAGERVEEVGPQGRGRGDLLVTDQEKTRDEAYKQMKSRGIGDPAYWFKEMKWWVLRAGKSPYPDVMREDRKKLNVRFINAQKFNSIRSRTYRVASAKLGFVKINALVTWEELAEGLKAACLGFEDIWNQALHDRTSFLVGMADSEEKERTKQFTLAVVCIPFSEPLKQLQALQGEFAKGAGPITQLRVPLVRSKLDVLVADHMYFVCNLGRLWDPYFMYGKK